MITEGLYVPTDIGEREYIWHRYVIAQFKGMICYSRGAEKHYHCSITTFEKWVKRWKCERRALNGVDLQPSKSSAHSI